MAVRFQLIFVMLYLIIPQDIRIITFLGTLAILAMLLNKAAGATAVVLSRAVPVAAGTPRPKASVPLMATKISKTA